VAAPGESPDDGAIVSEVAAAAPMELDERSSRARPALVRAGSGKGGDGLRGPRGAPTASTAITAIRG